MKPNIVKGLAVLTLAAVGAAGAACGSDDAQRSGSGNATTAEANAVDRAFVAQMVPHHEMAVEMARTALERAERAKVEDTADVIVSAQEAEIQELRDIAEDLGVELAVTHTHGSHGNAMASDAETLGLSMDEMGMSMDMAALKDAKSFDRAFIDAMVPHHQGAIRMARAQLAKGSDARLKDIARAIVEAQAKEIREMNSWRADWYGKPSPAGGVPQA